MQPITRREFLKLSETAALGAALATNVALFAQTGSPSTTKVALAKGTDYVRILIAALDKLGGAQYLARSGDCVVLKPTAAWNRPPELAANTNPLVVQALARLCVDAGARTVTVFDRTSFRADLCYHVSGLTSALTELRAAQVRLVTLTPADFVAVPGTNGRLCRYAVEADRFVNVPQAKHHARRGLSLGAANLLGAVGGGVPLSDEFLVWTLRQLRPSLTVLDATRLLLRNGPAGGDAADVEQRDTLLAGRDALAVDSVGCGLFGRKWQEFAYFRLAVEAKLGEPDLRRINILEI
jgi:uncharacterized protein (DUF362 family)